MWNVERGVWVHISCRWTPSARNIVALIIWLPLETGSACSLPWHRQCLNIEWLVHGPYSDCGHQPYIGSMTTCSHTSPSRGGVGPPALNVTTRLLGESSIYYVGYCSLFCVVHATETLECEHLSLTLYFAVPFPLTDNNVYVPSPEPRAPTQKLCAQR